jgi:hypothetical protein
MHSHGRRSLALARIFFLHLYNDLDHFGNSVDRGQDRDGGRPSSERASVQFNGMSGRAWLGEFFLHFTLFLQN